jgi:hypothetical protein
MPLDRDLLTRFHRVLVEEIRETAPEYLSGEFTVAEIYQKLVPYGVHRSRLGVEMNGDYEDALLRLLAGEGEYLRIQSDPARQRIKRELESSNPNTGIYREFAAVGVRLNADRIPAGSVRGEEDPSSSADPVPPAAGTASSPHLFELADAVEEETPAEPARKGPAAGGSLAGGKGGFPGGLKEATTASATGSARSADSPSAPVSGGKGGGAAGQALPTPQMTTGAGQRPTSCPGCSRGLPDRASLRFCPHCGVNVLERGCPACSEPLEWAWAFCVACGTAVDAG